MRVSFPVFAVFVGLALLVVTPVLAADGTGYEPNNPYVGEELIDIRPVQDAEDLAEEVEEGIEYLAAESHEHKGATGLPQMDASWFPSQVFWLAITFICLYLIFAKKLLPEISSTLENRRTQIEGDISSAQDLKEEAEKVQNAYEEMLAQSRDEASALFAKAEDDIRKKTDKKTQSFATVSVRKMSETEAEIADAKTAAMSEMHALAAEISSMAAEKIIGVSTDINQAKDLVKTLDKKKAA